MSKGAPFGRLNELLGLLEITGLTPTLVTVDVMEKFTNILTERNHTIIMQINYLATSLRVHSTHELRE